MSARGARERVEHPSRGIALVLAGTGLITLNDAAIKAVVLEHPLGQAVFLRGLFVLLPIAFLVMRAGGWKAMAVRSASGQALSAGLLVGALFLFVFSLSRLPLSICVIIIYTNPLFVTALAPLIVGERVGWRRWGAVLLGFLGTVLILWPDQSGFSWLLLVPLAASLLTALRDLVTRRLVVGETSVSILAYSSLAVTLCALPVAAFDWEPLGLDDFALLAGAGLAFTFGLFCLTDSLRYADASLISPFKYSGVVLAAVLGYLIWSEVPDLADLAGAGLIMASGLFILHRERRMAPDQL
ncbi:MAG: DMT family transporter [Pseudomonadota bacterium]